MENINLQHAKVFRPRMDWWVMGIVLGYLLFLLAGVPAVLWYGDAAVYVTIPVALFLALSAISLIDKAYYMVYILADHELLIRTHLRLVRIPYRSMDRLTFSGMAGLLTLGGRRRYALSRKNISISIRSGVASTISVSPNDRDTFVNELLTHIESERSSRAARVQIKGHAARKTAKRQRNR